MQKKVGNKKLWNLKGFLKLFAATVTSLNSAALVWNRRTYRTVSPRDALFNHRVVPEAAQPMRHGGLCLLRISSPEAYYNAPELENVIVTDTTPGAWEPWRERVERRDRCPKFYAKLGDHPFWIFQDSPLFLGPVLDFMVSWIWNPQNLISWFSAESLKLLLLDVRFQG